MAETTYDFSGLRALFVNCTLKQINEKAITNTDGMISASRKLMEKFGVTCETVRVVDHNLAFGVMPDMRDYGWQEDGWPDIYEQSVKPADIIVVATPIWVGEISSVCKQFLERLYGNASLLNAAGQSIYYGKVGSAMADGNEDGGKQCARHINYNLQHVGITVPPQAEATWLGWQAATGPGMSYSDEGSDAHKNDFTNMHITFMSWNLMHFAKMLKSNGGIPAYGNSSQRWMDGERFGYEGPN